MATSQFASIAAKHAVSEIKQNLRVISVQDILTLFLQRLDGDSSFREWIASQVTVMAVDEAQDLSKLNFVILDRLLQINPSMKVFIVGDPRQNIFEFNGGSYKHLNRFLASHPAHKTKSLTITYRCGQVIADFVNGFRFIDCSNLQLQSRTAEAGSLVIKEAHSETEEAQSVLDELSRIGNITTCAVLSNNLKYLETLIRILREHDIPYRVFGGRKVLKRHIRILNHILRIIDTENAYSIRKIAQYAGINIVQDGKKRKSKFFSTDLGQAILSIREEKPPFQEMVSRVISEIMQSEDDDQERKDDYSAFVDTVAAFGSVSDYLAAFATDREQFAQFYNADYQECAISTEEGYLSLSTIHSAKGLEWDHVFIMGLCEGNFPNPFFCQKLPPAEQMEFFNNEWKKMYVAATRARESLCLSYSTSIHRKGYSFHKAPSRFISKLRA